MSQPDPRADLVRLARLAWERGYMVATDGNLSLRLGDDRVLVTPSGRVKAYLEPADLIEVDLTGQVLAGSGKPSVELGLHLAAYRLRPDARAVVHAHPPLTTALSLAGRELDPSGLPELLYYLDKVPTAPYATPGTAELVRAAEPYLAAYPALILAHHGTLTCGPDLMSAWALTEKLEHAAQVLIAAETMGGARPLPAVEQARLAALRDRSGPLPLAQRIELVHLPDTREFMVEKIHRDERGEAHLIVDDRAIRRLAVLTLQPGTGWRGRHVHSAKREGFYVLSGSAQAELVCAQTRERLAMTLEPGARLIIPPGVAHRFAALTPLTFVEFTDSPYRAADDQPFDF